MNIVNQQEKSEPENRSKKLRDIEREVTERVIQELLAILLLSSFFFAAFIYFRYAVMPNFGAGRDDKPGSIVVGILGALAAVAIPLLLSANRKAEEAAEYFHEVESQDESGQPISPTAERMFSQASNALLDLRIIILGTIFSLFTLTALSLPPVEAADSGLGPREWRDVLDSVMGSQEQVLLLLLGVLVFSLFLFYQIAGNANFSPGFFALLREIYENWASNLEERWAQLKAIEAVHVQAKKFGGSIRERAWGFLMIGCLGAYPVGFMGAIHFNWIVDGAVGFARVVGLSLVIGTAGAVFFAAALGGLWFWLRSHYIRHEVWRRIKVSTMARHFGLLGGEAVMSSFIFVIMALSSWALTTLAPAIWMEIAARDTASKAIILWLVFGTVCWAAFVAGVVIYMATEIRDKVVAPAVKVVFSMGTDHVGDEAQAKTPERSPSSDVQFALP